MSNYTYQVLPAPPGQFGWLVVKGDRVLIHCREKEEAHRIMEALIGQSASAPEQRDGDRQGVSPRAPERPRTD